MNNEMLEIKKQIEILSERLKQLSAELKQMGFEMSETKRKYAVHLAKRFLYLKGEHPVTYLRDIINGEDETSQLRYDKDIAEGKWESTKQAILNCRTVISAYQSLLKAETYEP